MAYLVKPFTKGDLVPAIEMAVSRHEEIAALEKEVADLSERLETRKLVDRAKGLLHDAARAGRSRQAFRWIQKTSMDRRMSMRQVAQIVVNENVARPSRPPDRPPADRGGEDSVVRGRPAKLRSYYDSASKCGTVLMHPWSGHARPDVPFSHSIADQSAALTTPGPG